jgi:Nucleotidyl transferase AbiEii toxin, Type IV TA system
VDPGLLKLAEIGLRVAGRYGFALAGGYAVQAHGILDRPSEDIDLFTAWERRGDFTAAVDAVVEAYRADGYAVAVTQQFDTFARLAVTDPVLPGFDRSVLAELFGMLPRYPDRRFVAYGADPGSHRRDA